MSYAYQNLKNPAYVRLLTAEGLLGKYPYQNVRNTAYVNLLRNEGYLYTGSISKSSTPETKIPTVSVKIPIGPTPSAGPNDVGSQAYCTRVYGGPCPGDKNIGNQPLSAGQAQANFGQQIQDALKGVFNYIDNGFKSLTQSSSPASADPGASAPGLGTNINAPTGSDSPTNPPPQTIDSSTNPKIPNPPQDPSSLTAQLQKGLGNYGFILVAVAIFLVVVMVLKKK